MAAKNYDKAIALYTKALSTGASDALALGERGYAKFLRAKTEPEQSSAIDEARRDLWLALGSRGEPKTYAQVWYNLGLLYETWGEPEEARASFARSEAVAPSSQAASKLAGKSKCLAAIDRKRSHYESTHVVDGWVGIAKVRNIKIAAKDPAQATEQARAAVCTDSRPHESDVSHGCTSQPPWHVSHDYGAQPFMDLEELLVPLKNDKFLVVEVGLVGGWPARCLFGAFPSHVVSGRVLVLRSADVQATVNDAVPAQNDQELECIDGPTEAIETAYDMHTGRFLLEVRSVVPNVPKLSFNSAGTEATLEGAGCHESVAL